MAANPDTVLVTTPQSETVATNSNDPFVDRSTPRHNRGSLAALVAAIQQVSCFMTAPRLHQAHA